MKILSFREVKCVSNHIAGKMQSWALSPGLLVPERFLIPSSCPSSSDVSNALPEVCVSGLGEAPSAALWSPPSPSSPLIPTRAQIPRQWPGLRPSPFVRGAEPSRGPGKMSLLGQWALGSGVGTAGSLPFR